MRGTFWREQAIANNPTKEISPRLWVCRQSVWIAKYDQTAFSPSEADVGTMPILDESESTAVIRSHKTEQNNLFFLTLKRIHAGHESALIFGNMRERRFSSVEKQWWNEPSLRRIWCDYSYAKLWVDKPR